MRLAARIALALLAVLAACALGLWVALSPPPPLAPAARGAELAGVTVIEPGVSRRAGVTLIVREDRIASIAPTAGGAPGPFAGAFVLPGLVDMHVHFPPDSGVPQAELFALLYLLHGVTAVRDMGDVDGTALGPAVAGLREGGFAGPRLFTCGVFVDGPDPTWTNSRVVRDADDARAAVGAVADAGFDCVKVYEGLSPEGLAAVRQAATERGLPVVGHVPRAVPYADSGIADVQHFTRAPSFDRPDPRPFPELMDAWTAVDDAAIERIVAHALATGTANTPTLVSSERLARQDQYERLRGETDAALLPRFYRDVLWRPGAGGRAMSAADLANLRAYLPVAQRLVRRLVEAGAVVHVGTDVLTSFVVPGASLHRELRLFVEAGLSPEKALALATRGNASALPLAGLGRLEPGAPADLVVFREDPTRSLDALASVAAVVVDGRLYPRETLDAQLARTRTWFEGAVFDAISVALARRAMERIFEQRQD